MASRKLQARLNRTPLQIVLLWTKLTGSQKAKENAGNVPSRQGSWTMSWTKTPILIWENLWSGALSQFYQGSSSLSIKELLGFGLLVNLVPFLILLLFPLLSVPALHATGPNEESGIVLSLSQIFWHNRRVPEAEENQYEFWEFYC